MEEVSHYLTFILSLFKGIGPLKSRKPVGCTS
jgi:hypothetical protein